MSTLEAMESVPARRSALPRLLIVDDDPLIRHTLNAGLAREGFEVAMAATADEAVESGSRFRPDLALLDIGLPGMDGIDLATLLRRRCGTSVVYLSGRNDDFTIRRAAASGAAGYLVKPVDIPGILPTLRTVLGHSRDLEQRRRKAVVAARRAQRERKAIKAELHDGVSQEIFGALLSARRIEKGMRDAGSIHAPELRALHEALEVALSSCHALIHGAPVPSLLKNGLVGALVNLAAVFQRGSGTTCVVEGRALPPDLLSPDAAHHVYRIAEEAMANALRHSNCSSILLNVAHRGLMLEVTVSDDGGVDLVDGQFRTSMVRSPGLGSGQGMSNMRRRARLLGGRIEFRGQSPHGLQVRLQIPVGRSGEG